MPLYLYYRRLDKSDGGDMNDQQGSSHWRINLHRLYSNRRHVYSGTVLASPRSHTTLARRNPSVHRIHRRSRNRSMDRLDHGHNATPNANRRNTNQRSSRNEKQLNRERIRTTSCTCLALEPQVAYFSGEENAHEVQIVSTSYSVGNRKGTR